MNTILEKKYEYLSNFFKTAIEQNRLFHSIIFHGNNNYIQYAMALELARQLNCLKDGTSDCDCQNCRWIRENRHPAVMTISKIDNKNDKSKTVISEEQINEVLNTLINSSNYHRVFIFCDADVKNLTTTEQEEYKEFLSTGFNVPSENNTNSDKIWYPSGLNNKCTSEAGINSMLKSIEEPPSDVTFIFLTKNKEDLLSTIISRSQSFHLADCKKVVYDFSFLHHCFRNYPIISKNEVFELTEALINYQDENNLETTYVLDCIQAYLSELLKANVNNNALIKTIYKDIERIEETKKMAKSHMKENILYEDLSFYLAKRQ